MIGWLKSWNVKMTQNKGMSPHTVPQWHAAVFFFVDVVFFNHLWRKVGGKKNHIQAEESAFSATIAKQEYSYVILCFSTTLQSCEVTIIRVSGLIVLKVQPPEWLLELDILSNQGLCWLNFIFLCISVFYIFILCQCCAWGLVRFRYQTQLVRVR